MTVHVSDPYEGGPMRKLSILLLSALMLIPVLAFSAAPVFAGTQGGCAPGDTTKIRLYENSIGDTSGGDDQLYVCGNVADLSQVDHTLPGVCQVAQGIGWNSWNDCVSSFVAYMPVGYKWLFYGAANYGTYMNCVDHDGYGTRYNLSPNDGLSSLKVVVGNC